MCGRYTLRKSKGELAKEFEVAEETLPIVRFGRYNIAPTQQVVALILTPDGKQQLVQLRWGLIPHWAKDDKIAHKLINARCETISEKPAFRQALKSRRCVVLADGFFEWQTRDGKKQPFFFHLKDDLLFGFAGLYESWCGPEGIEIASCCIVTTEANELVKAVHGRMPVILKREKWESWLRGSEEHAALLVPLPPEEMQGFAVDVIVNSPANDRADCVSPVAEKIVA